MCENCDENEEDMKKDWITLRFIGGRHKKYPYRGPYNSFETGKVYLVPPYYKPLPYWEEVDETVKADEPEAEIEVELEVIDEKAEPDIQLPSPGLHKKFGGDPPSFEDGIMSMDVPTLQVYITGQGKKVDGRWGRKRLIKEALSIQ